VGGGGWDRHLNNCPGPPLVDVIYLSEVEYNCDTLIDLPWPALASDSLARMQTLQMPTPIHAYTHGHRY
jgi:hypothetical protein